MTESQVVFVEPSAEPGEKHVVDGSAGDASSGLQAGHGQFEHVEPAIESATVEDRGERLRHRGEHPGDGAAEPEAGCCRLRGSADGIDARSQRAIRLLQRRTTSPQMSQRPIVRCSAVA